LACDAAIESGHTALASISVVTMQLLPVRYLGILLFTAFFLNISLSATPLHAATFDFSFYGVDPDQNVLSANGTLTATDNGGEQFTITAITGTIIDDLVSPTGAKISVLLSPGDFFNDNLLFPNASGANKLDGNGFSFQTESGSQYNIFSDGTGYSSFDDTSGRASLFTLTSFTVTNNGSFIVRQDGVAVPEPLPLPVPVLGLVIGAGSLLLSVRRKLVG
jgi:hypothetical protein